MCNPPLCFLSRISWTQSNSSVAEGAERSAPAAGRLPGSLSGGPCKSCCLRDETPGPYLRGQPRGAVFLFVAFKNQAREAATGDSEIFLFPSPVASDVPSGIHNFPKPVNG